MGSADTFTPNDRERFPVFRLLPKGGGQSRRLLMSEFFNCFQSDLTSGSWFFLRGDGTVASGSAPFSSGTAPVAIVQQKFMPSGPNGTDHTVQQYTGSSGGFFSSSSGITTPGNFSLLALVRLDDTNTLRSAVLTNFGSVPNASALLDFGTTGIPNMFVYNGSTQTQCPMPVGTTLRAYNFIVYTYQRVGGAADNVTRGYINGSASTTSSMSQVLVNATASGPWFTARTSNSAEILSGSIAFVAKTDALLHPSTIESMAKALNGELSTAVGGRVSMTRGTDAKLDHLDGTVVTFPAGRTRVGHGGILVEPAAINICLRSEEFSLSPWGTNAGTLTRVDRNVLSPDGAYNGCTATDNDGASVESIIQTFAEGAIAANTTYSFSIYAKANAANPMYDLRLRTNGGLGNSNANFTLTDTWKRYYVQTISVSTASAGIIIEQASAASTGAIDIWGAQLESWPFPTSYFRTTTAAGTRALTNIQVPTDPSWPIAAGEVRMRVMVPVGIFYPFSGLTRLISTVTGVNGWTLYAKSSVPGALELSTGNGTSFTVTTSAALTWVPGQWYDIRFKWGRGIHKVWRDGIEIISGTGKNNPTAIGANAFIGQSESTNQHWVGYIADLEVYNDDLR